MLVFRSIAITPLFILVVHHLVSLLRASQWSLLIKRAFHCLSLTVLGLVIVAITDSLFFSAYLYGERSLVETLLDGMMNLLPHIKLDSISFSPLNFVAFNQVWGLSTFYGFNSHLYYVSQTWPIVLLWWIPDALRAMRRALFTGPKTAHDELLQCCTYLVIFTTAFLSISEHSEHRYAFPLVPLALTLVSSVRPKHLAFGCALQIVVLVVLNLHQIVWPHMLLLPASGNIRYDILTSCHDTPLYSAFHSQPQQVELRFLECAPLSVV